MEREDLLALAQQGHPKAIAALLNQQLKYREMRCRVSLADGVLHVVLSATDDTAQETPDRGAALEFLRAKIINLDIANLKRVRLYGLAPGTENEATVSTTPLPQQPAWTQEFAVVVGEYSSLVSSPVSPQDDPSIATQASPTTTKPHTQTTARLPVGQSRSRRQPTLTSLLIVGITLSLIIVSGYKLIARNSRSSPTTPDRVAPSPRIPAEP